MESEVIRTQEDVVKLNKACRQKTQAVLMAAQQASQADRPPWLVWQTLLTEAVRRDKNLTDCVRQNTAWQPDVTQELPLLIPDQVLWHQEAIKCYENEKGKRQKLQ